MNLKEIKKMEIVGVKETEFNCHLCDSLSNMKYELMVDNNEDEKTEMPVCLDCHNKIAEQLFSQTKKRRYRY